MGRIAFFLSFALLALFAVNSWAGVGGSVSGTVEDASSAVVPNAAVKAINIDSGVEQQVTTNDQGFYSFPDLPIGRYNIVFESTGFKPCQRAGLAIDVGTKLRVDVTLEVGQEFQQVTVSDVAIHAETQSTQMGEVIANTMLTAVPLNGRSFTDLLGLQAGVIPINSQPANAIVMAGVSNAPPSGDLNPGNQSISGQRETANGFIVNGGDVEEDINMGVAILPNLDSIAEFRILTNNFDAEYGNYSGGQIIVATKSGANAIHGDAFEFLRDTALDAKPYFSPSRPKYDQNQFGGTLGGPIKKNRSFFFVDYQGSRTTQGLETGLVSVPSVADRSGNLIELADSLTRSVSSPYFASLLSNELGYPVSAGEAYYKPKCSNSSQCVFPNAVIPMSAWSAPAKFLLNYVPQPNVGSNQFYTSAHDQVIRDDKGAFRWDANAGRWGTLSAYYFIDDYTLNNPYPQGQGGANVPSGMGGTFDASSAGRAELLSLGDTKTFATNEVNEFHFSYMRYANNIGTPVGGVGIPLACQGFVTAVNETQKCAGSTFNTTGIYPLDPAIEGIENVALQNMGITIGTDISGLLQRNNTYQWVDNFSKVVGTHTLKFGGEFHWDQVNTKPNATFNGSFQFNGSETGSDFADYLIGAASTYVQAEQGSFYPRNKYAGVFGQDSWRLRSNLTINYGLRWDLIEPWYEKYNQVQTFVPGRQSIVFPGAPDGFLFPGDPGIPRTLSPVRRGDFVPRVGLAYSPDFGQGWLRKMFGDAGKSSIRVGFGMFYTAFEGLSASIMYTIPPYGYNFVPSAPLFATPTISTNGTSIAQPFPAVFPPFGASASNPNSSVDWSRFEPIVGDPAFANDNRPPYAEQFNLSIERQIGANLLFSVSYVGSQGHHLMVVEESNPGNPQLCLQLMASGQCSQSDVDQSRPYWPAFGGNTLQKTIGNSEYNAFETNLRYNGSHGEFLISYTFSKSIDDSSNLGEAVDPYDLSYTRAISAFDMKHNFVASYRYNLPFESLFRRDNRLTEGWSLSGTMRFSTGLPVTLYNPTNTSLLGTNPNGVNNNWLDEPNFTPGSLEINTDPRNGRLAFNTALFSLPTLGQLGNSPRRFFYGPGIDNFDMALLKVVRLTENKTLQFRLEAFNLFNHSQFYGTSSVQGNITSPEFGQIVGTSASPRLLQLGAKFFF
jgi:hypothetical protein